MLQTGKDRFGGKLPSDRFVAFTKCEHSGKLEDFD